MQDLERAIAEIGAIRSQLAQGAKFHGLGPTAFAATGVLAFLAAIAQARWLPAGNGQAFLMLWIGAAAASAAIIGAEMIARSRRLHSELADEMIVAAIAQFLPAALAGAALTPVLIWFAPQSLWMLPGLWQIAFGLGVAASCRFLPRGLWAIAAWYVACGLGCLALAQGRAAFSPWSMGLPFGVGELAVAAILLETGSADD
jgi:hypothetical protein